MARDILMPQMGYDMTEGTLVRWIKKVGDKIQRGDVVAEIETDKATVEIEAFDSGTLLRIIAEPGQTLPVGQPIATLGEKGEQLPEAAAPEPAPAPAPAKTAPTPPPGAADPAPTQGPSPAAPTPAAPAPAAPAPAAPAPAGPPVRIAVPGAPGERPFASPLARRIAEQLGVDLITVSGSGPGGRIVADDVEAAAASGPAAAPAPAPAASPEPAPEPAPAPAASPEPAPEPAPALAPASAPAAPSASPPPLPEGAEDIEPNRLRKAMARRMGESKRTAPHFYVAVDCNAEALLKLREQLAAKKVKVSVNDILVKALALATLAHPNVNAAFLDGKIRKFSKVDVGIAVATENGLLSPAIADAGAKSLKDIATATRDLAERARAGRLRPEEYGGGTVTLSNLGMYGVDAFLAILNPPQALIVSVGAAADRVVAVKGKPAVAKVFTAWAAADHRVLDGVEVGEFMQTFRGIVEDPGKLSSYPRLPGESAPAVARMHRLVRE